MLNLIFAGRVFPAIFLSLILLLFSAGCDRQSNSNANISTSEPPVLPDAAESAFDLPQSNINLAAPLVVSTRPEDVELCRDINETIEKSPYKGARWGVIAVSLKDGRVLCERDGRKVFNPASIQKTLTAVVGLDRLGADYRWKTSVYAENQISSDGTLSSDLTLYGTGAPDFDSAALENLANQLQAKNLRRVSGNIVGDSSYFRGDAIGDGWTWNELQWYYGAEASALSIDENTAFVNVENGEGRATTDYLRVTVGKPAPIAADSNNANAASNGNAENYEAGGIKRGLDNNDFYVWGKTKSFGARVSVHDPAGLAAKKLKELLVKKGIAVEGETLSRDWKSENRADPSKMQELAAIESKTLGEIVRRMNKNSVNLYAELILRTIGKKFGGEIPSNIQLPQNVRGDDISGAAVIRRWLLQRNIAADDVQISDGSGLSRLDFVTPEAFARAFIFAGQSKYALPFTDSLPVAATDGTLGGRFARAKGKILAKTGTISFVHSLAGYAKRKDGEVITFAVIVNNEPRKTSVGTLDTIVLKLIGEAAENKSETDAANKQSDNANAGKNTNANANTTNFVIESKNGRP